MRASYHAGSTFIPSAEYTCSRQKDNQERNSERLRLCAEAMPAMPVQANSAANLAEYFFTEKLHFP
jgi:hypothetical protein